MTPQYTGRASSFLTWTGTPHQEPTKRDEEANGERHARFSAGSPLEGVQAVNVTAVGRGSRPISARKIEHRDSAGDHDTSGESGK